MDSHLDIGNNPNSHFENDYVIVNLNTEEITWKPGKYTPKMAIQIQFWLDVRNNVNSKN